MNQTSTRSNPQTSTVCVRNLSNDTNEADIRRLFSPYGAVHRVRLVSGETEHGSRQLGYVDLTSEAVLSAVADLDGTALNGFILDVSQGSGIPDSSKVAEGSHPGGAARMEDDIPRYPRKCRYVLASVEKAQMPIDGQEGDWHRYVLSSGNARITGLHRGTLEEVTAYATDCAEEFNLRSATGKSSRMLAYQKKK